MTHLKFPLSLKFLGGKNKSIKQCLLYFSFKLCLSTKSSNYTSLLCLNYSSGFGTFCGYYQHIYNIFIVLLYVRTYVYSYVYIFSNIFPFKYMNLTIIYQDCLNVYYMCFNRINLPKLGSYLKSRAVTSERLNDPPNLFCDWPINCTIQDCCLVTLDASSVRFLCNLHIVRGGRISKLPLLVDSFENMMLYKPPANNHKSGKCSLCLWRWNDSPQTSFGK